MKHMTLGFWALFVTVGVVLAVLATRQPLRSASSTNANLHPVSAVARQTDVHSSAQLADSNPALAIAVVVRPLSAPITSLVTQQFTATVTGTTNANVSWYVDDVLGGNATVGWIDSNGLYTPPTDFVVGQHTIKAVSQADGTKLGTAIGFLTGFTGMYTNKNDNSRTGLNSQETALTPTNVKSSTFGKLFSRTLDGKVDAQPLYVANLYIPHPQHGTAGTYNVIFVATENDSVYGLRR